jgi:putative hydrolase
VPWLRDHLSSLVGELIDSGAGGIDGAALRDLARRLVTSDPRSTVRALLRGEAARMLAGPEQAALFDRIQAAMALIEGYAEHAMDHASTSRADELARLRARLEERRQSRTGLGTIIAKLLGLEIKMEQYRIGKAFCDAVVAEAGIQALNQAWSEPSALPTLIELDRPSAWVARVAAPAHA